MSLTNKTKSVKKDKIYLYPITNESLPVIGNNYISDLKNSLESKGFLIINKEPTKLGMIDIIIKLTKCDIIYFNWIEDLPDKKMGYLQIGLLMFIIMMSKILNKKLIWFVHDNLSHAKINLKAKQFIVILMRNFSDYILAHTQDTIYKENPKFHSFDHPVAEYKPISPVLPFKYDLLIWGKMLPYKGIVEFLDFYSKSKINGLKVLVAGEFTSEKYFQQALKSSNQNVEILNKPIPEHDLDILFSRSKYILFTYNSSSVLSSAALCKTISKGKLIIGPNIGSFKEFGKAGFIYTYNSFQDIESLLFSIHGDNSKINFSKVENYVERTTWSKFGDFFYNLIN